MTERDLPHVVRLPAPRKSLRISFVTETYPPEVNGVAGSVARFVEGLHALNHEIELVRPRQACDAPIDGEPDVNERFHEVLRSGVAIPRYPGLRMGLPSRSALLKLWGVRRPDIVHIVTEGPLGWSALQAASRLGIPVSSDLRTNFDAYSLHYGIGWLRRPIVAYLRKFHNRTARTLVPTEAMRLQLARQGFRNLEVVSRGVDATLFDPARRSEALRRSWGAGPETPVLLHVGRLAPEKNLGALAECFETVRVRCPDARFVIVGDGPDRSALQARCPYAVFAGQRSGEDLATHYASGDVFAFPSLTETFGNVTLEAMASGLAVVAFDYAAAGELILNRTSGLLSRYGDTEGWIADVAALCRARPEIAKFAHAAREAALRASWACVSQRFEQVLLGVAAAGESAASLGALRRSSAPAV